MCVCTYACFHTCVRAYVCLLVCVYVCMGGCEHYMKVYMLAIVCLLGCVGTRVMLSPCAAGVETPIVTPVFIHMCPPTSVQRVFVIQ